MSELSVEQKANRYDKILKEVKDFFEGKQKMQNDVTKTLEYLFPELNDPNDEQMWKLVKNYVSNISDLALKTNHITREYLMSWLKKQEQSKKISIWKHWKNGIAGNGEGKLTFLIKSGPTYSLSSCLSFECDYIELSELENLMLEKQDDFNSEYWRGYRDGKQEVFDKYAKLEKQNKQNIKPKFKIGDWVTNGACTWRIDSIEDNMYYNDCGKFSCGGDIKSIDEQYHLWTIEDAKPGDVLNAKGIFIYKKHDKDCVYFYCAVNLKGEFIGTCVDDIWSNNYKVYPATKEQYNLLFKKIQKSGYEWDTEKKMLKHIPKFKTGNWIVFNGLTLYINKVEKGYYRTISKGGVTNSYDWNIDNAARLWTIEEARDGDVLSYITDEGDLWIMIYQSLYKPYENHVHYHALLIDDDFSDKGTCCIDINYLKPAIKEQRDLLFKKMQESGYMWDENIKRVIKYGE